MTEGDGHKPTSSHGTFSFPSFCFPLFAFSVLTSSTASLIAHIAGGSFRSFNRRKHFVEPKVVVCNFPRFSCERRWWENVLTTFDVFTLALVRVFPFLIGKNGNSALCNRAPCVAAQEKVVNGRVELGNHLTSQSLRGHRRELDSPVVYPFSIIAMVNVD